ncbi:MAG: hypothetical protein JO023_27705 [Chloroflexi bacterium]|nr:hypothetical protein [Chloroflexota bacterium]
MALRARYLAALGGLLVVAAVVLVGVGDEEFVVRNPPPLDACATRLPLTTLSLPGPPWEEHRHWLIAPIPFGRDRSYAIVDQQTGGVFRWPWVNNRDGQAYFGVLTRWTWLHRDWAQHSWVLVTDCPA